MIWSIRYSRYPKLSDLINELSLSDNIGLDTDISNDNSSLADILRLISFSCLTYIKRYISRNGYLFKKTQKRLGVTAPGLNYIPSNVKILRVTPLRIDINLDIKGIERAFRPIVILPKRAKWLTIPVDKEGFRKRAYQVHGLFKPKGKNVLAKSLGNNRIKPIYALSKQVYQPVDRRMLPKETDVLRNAYNYLKTMFN